ncbi:hypothetical protein WJX75_008474 [Coccomyxa subellipsoidea]|uniref:RING-type domain-containing protein n=1 Tax=Coccomyxa subellipsoidea TaxID=248742 RepID=A0ABR2YNJ7_9CHLO
MSVPGSNRKGKHAAFSSMGMGMALKSKPSVHLGSHAGPSSGLASASRRLRSARSSQSWNLDSANEVVAAPECSSMSQDTFEDALPGQQYEEDNHVTADAQREGHNARCPMCNSALQIETSRKRMPQLWPRGFLRPTSTPEALVMGSCAVLVTIISTSFLRWAFGIARRILCKKPSLPPGDCTAAAPDESWIGEQCVVGDHSSYPSQAPSASAPRKSRKQQRASVRITDPLWKYAALAVYPDRLKTRTASS